LVLLLQILVWYLKFFSGLVLVDEDIADFFLRLVDLVRIFVLIEVGAQVLIGNLHFLCKLVDVNGYIAKVEFRELVLVLVLDLFRRNRHAGRHKGAQLFLFDRVADTLLKPFDTTVAIVDGILVLLEINLPRTVSKHEFAGWIRKLLQQPVLKLFFRSGKAQTNGFLRNYAIANQAIEEALIRAGLGQHLIAKHLPVVFFKLGKVCDCDFIAINSGDYVHVASRLDGTTGTARLVEEHQAGGHKDDEADNYEVTCVF